MTIFQVKDSVLREDVEVEALWLGVHPASSEAPPSAAVPLRRKSLRVIIAREVGVVLRFTFNIRLFRKINPIYCR